MPLYLRASALVAAWRPGVEGGNAIWELLTGVTGFSGRLAQSWPHSAGAVHFGGISPWYEKYCSEECPGLTVDMSLPHGLTLDALKQLRQATPGGVDEEERHPSVCLAEELALMMQEDAPRRVIALVRIKLQKLNALAPPERSERALLHGLARVTEDEDIGSHRFS